MMYETAIVAAILVNRKHEEDLADRRVFYGPDAQPETEKPRRTLRSRLPHRKTTPVA